MKEPDISEMIPKRQEKISMKCLEILKTKSLKKTANNYFQMQEKSDSVMETKGHVRMDFHATPALWKSRASATIRQ